MLDIKLIRENPQKIKDNLEKRQGYDVTIVDKVIEIDLQWRDIKKGLDSLKSNKNKESNEINKLKSEKKDFKSQIIKVQEISKEIKEIEEEEKEILSQRDKYLSKIPNMLDKEVPNGKDDEENVSIKIWGKKPKFDFIPKDHIRLCEENDWLDTKQASKTSGARFYYLKNELVILEIALYNFVINKFVEKGFIPLRVPHMLRREMIGKSVSLEDFEDALYKIEGEDLHLIATSEQAIAVYHNDQILNCKDLPKKYIGISPCYRKEAGVTKDSKGMIRVHHFNKIEQFVFSRQKDSDKFHKEILNNTEEIFQELGLYHQIVDICSGDMGSFATRKYDLEAWLPSQDKFREMASASNYRDYGARRLNLRYQDEKNNLKFCHTQNNTGIATGRAMVAIIEQYQTKDGNVIIPEVLRKYMGNRKFLLDR